MILSVGELNENKNHATVIRSLAGVPDVTYVIAGKGSLSSELEKIANDCDVNLMLLGFRTDVEKLYKTADVYVLPSYREGLNVSLMEAMSCGCDCIASDIRGNRDLIEDDKFLADSHSVEEWKSRIEFVLDGHSNRKVNIVHIRDFGREAVGGKMNSLYQTT